MEVSHSNKNSNALEDSGTQNEEAVNVRGFRGGGLFDSKEQ